MRMTLDLLHEFANTEVFCLFHNATCNPDTLKSMSLSSRCVNKPMDCSLSTGLPVLIWAASTFSSASLSWSKRSTNTGTLLLTSLPVLTLVLLQSNKTRLSISWAREPDGCSLSTGLSPCLIIAFLILVGLVGSLHYLQLNPILSSNSI